MTHFHEVMWVLQRAAESDNGNVNNIAWLFLSLGFIFYGIIFMRYRNTDKRHRYEAEIRAEMANVTATDSFIRTLRGLSNSRMRGANNKSIRGARQSWF